MCCVNNFYYFCYPCYKVSRKFRLELVQNPVFQFCWNLGFISAYFWKLCLGYPVMFCTVPMYFCTVPEFSVLV